MPKQSNMTCDYDATIERLLAEQRQIQETLNQIKLAYSTVSEFEGLSLVGGIKAIIKRYLEEQNKVRMLEKELANLKKK